MDLIYFIKVLLRRKWTIFSLSVLAVIAAFVFLLFKKDLFESVAQYSTGFTAEKVRLTDGSSAVDIYTVDIKFNNVIATFQSPRVIGMLSYKLMLHDLENPASPYRKLTNEEKKSPALKAIQPAAAIDLLRKKVTGSSLLNIVVPEEEKVNDLLKLYRYDYNSIKQRLITRRVERTDYIDIIYQSENPELSAVVVNTLGTEFLNYYKNLNSQRNVESAKSIEQLLNLQQLKVDSLTSKLRLARISQGALDPVERTKSAMETEKEMTTKLAEEQSKYNLHSQLYNVTQERIKMLNTQLAGSSGTDVITLIRRRDQLIEQNSKLPSPDPAITSEISDLNIQISQKSGGGSGNRLKLQNELTEMQSKAAEEKAYMDASEISIRQLNSILRQLKGLSNVSPSSQVDIDAIDRQLEIENNELKTIREKLSQAQGLISDDPTTNFKQTLIGQADIEPVPKRKIVTMGLSGISVFMLCVLFFLMLEIFDSKIKTPTQFNKLVRLRQRAVINTVNLKKTPLDELMNNDPEGSRQQREIHFKNSIRKLRHEVEETGKKVFLICNTQKGTGKTVVLQSLAHAMLLCSKKVLMIDMNFENNTLSEQFGATRFIEELKATGESSAQVNSTELIRNAGFENLFIIGCHKGGYSPTEIISTEAFRRLLEDAENKFDYIFIESASLNERSDGYELFRFADQVITVFSARMVLTQADQKSVEIIKSLEDKNFGALLNEVDYDKVRL